MDILLLNLINVRIFVIYRPPPSQVNGLSVSLFFAEFSQFLEHIVILPETILILGDFNLHVNTADDVNSKRFLDLLLSFNLKQHVLCPTYNGRYTLDLMITRSDDLFVSDVCTSVIVISDHSPVLCHLNPVKPLSKTKFVNFRNLKFICLDSFKRDISVSLACVDNSDISKLVSHYHEVLASTLNTHAPLKRRAVTVRVKKAPWYRPEIDLQKKAVSEDDVSRLIGSSVKSCSLDPIPASLLLKCLDSFLPTLVRIINLSLSKGVFPDSLKVAKVTPILKKANADHEVFSNFRPVSNLQFLSKLIEKAVAYQLNCYLAEHDLHDLFQSAYKAMHSTETALVRIHNDILQSVDAGNCVILIFLDMSAAFDTVVHDVLLDRLANRFGVRDVVLSWFSSYLTNRKQFVGINESSSCLVNLDVGVPQGSVLGPLLYLLYTSPLADVVKHHNVSYHFHADDSQLYLSFKGNQQLAQSRQSLKCLTDISSWMLANGLKLNHDKTELMCIHSRFLSRPPLDEIVVGGETIVPCTSAVNLGIVFDECMTGELQVSKICKSSYFHLRNLSSIRKYLTTNAAHTIVHAFISSRLDYCNALLYGLPKYLVDRLQHVQNSAARVVTFTGKFDHITPVLIDLYWLPVYYRVIFKLLLLTYKALNDQVKLYQDFKERINRYLEISRQVLTPTERGGHHFTDTVSCLDPRVGKELQVVGSQVEDHIQPHDSVSQIALRPTGKPQPHVLQSRSGSGTASVSRASQRSAAGERIMLAVEKAAMIVEASLLSEQDSLAQERLRLEQQERLLKLKTEIAKTEAKEKIYEDFEVTDDEYSSQIRPSSGQSGVKIEPSFLISTPGVSSDERPSLSQPRNEALFTDPRPRQGVLQSPEKKPLLP
ncbi:uncharacterized protein [Montipora foliosa]|uniref:uncharacterized protein n=1 Tax=Montipora foliosa TaxID=591990 RepID=UPI0035F192C5